MNHEGSTTDSMYDLKDVPGKGKGLVATKKIPQGTRILCEEAVIQIPHRQDQHDSKEMGKYIHQQIDALTEQQRQAFLALHNIYPFKDPVDQYIGIIRTNALPIEDGDIGAGVLLEGSRINHSCDNNAQKDWNENIKRHTIHALRDINEGDEITVYYLAVHNSRQVRQEALRAKFKFSCSCRLCSLPPKEIKKNDEILEEIDRLDRLVGQRGLKGILSSPLQTLRYLHREYQLYNMTGLDDPGLSRVYLDAAQVVIAHGDLARGHTFAERAVRGWRISSGGDSRNVIEYSSLSQNPSQLPLYGMSMHWKMEIDDIPNTLESTEFEDWLWRREKSPRLRPRVDLRNRVIFPTFSGLPDERDVALDIYSRRGQPHRHWCFLAEIVDFQFLTRLHMEISDVDGRKIPLFFYTDSGGRELKKVEIQRGYTVAILYAQQHAFLFDKLGIRHEDPARFKVQISETI
ncbi:SET domain-containing protein [Penicillium sp. IBT 16267x]|nr:SET domain-containing protein [Penicillium sp. IBT 16267x]